MGEKKFDVGFIGAGQIASAVATGLLKNGVLKKSQIVFSDVSPAMLERAKTQLGISVETDNATVVNNAKFIFLAVKPQFVHDVLTSTKDSWSEANVIVSLCTGISLSFLKSTLDEIGAKTPQLIRAMPSTPCQVMEGVTALCRGPNVDEINFILVHRYLETTGYVALLPEDKINAFISIGGSAPGYVCKFIEALADAGVARGLTRADSLAIAAQVTKGTAKMVLESDQHPAVLREAVCSPGGATIAGILALEKNGFSAAVQECARATYEKAKSMDDEHEK